MSTSQRPEEIRAAMESLSKQQKSGRKLKYDPVKKMFVAVDLRDPAADQLMDVTPKDLESFLESHRT